MTHDRDPRRILSEAIGRVAPEVDLGSIDARAELRVEAELDSMDLLNIITAIHDATGLEIPERDYPQLATWSSFIEYLSGRL